MWLRLSACLSSKDPIDNCDPISMYPDVFVELI